MNTITKRLMLFLFGCIGTRLGLTYLAKTVSLQNLKYMGYAATLIAVGFIVLYLTGWRQTGPEVFGDKIWWNDLRPIHAVLYLLFAYNAIKGNDCAWMFLLADVVVGLGSFVAYHKNAGDFGRIEF
jgi:hypothetical protein